MAHDSRRDDYLRMSLRYALSLDESDPGAATRACAAIGRRLALERDTLPQTDADRAFHLVVRATELLDYRLPFVGDAQAETLSAQARSLLDEAVSLMATLLPHLKRWREVAENEEAYGEEVRAAYGDEVMDAANEKYVAMGEAAHLQAEELALAINEQLRRAMETGDPSGPEARKLVAMHGHWLRMYWPDGLYTPEAHKGLADGYVSDERFRAYYEKVAPGAAQFLRDAIHACA